MTLGAFFVQIFIAIFTYILTKKDPQKAKKPTADDLSFPTTDEASKVPVIFGTVLLESPNVFWLNDFYARSREKGQYYNIYAGLAHSLCFSGAKLRAIYFDDKLAIDFKNNLEENISVGSGTYYIYKPKLFSEAVGNVSNGVSGYFSFYNGDENQLSNEYMEKIEQEIMPSYKFMTYCVFGIDNDSYSNRFWFGNSTTLPKISYELERFPSNLGLDISYSEINGDANPAEVFYDILTDMERYGVGALKYSLNQNGIDLASFQNAAIKFKQENLGISLIFSEGTFDDIKQKIEDHCGCLFYVDTTSSKWSVKLLRNDYQPENLKFFDENNIVSLTNYNKPQINDLINEVKVKFKDKSEFFKERTATASNNAILFNRAFNNTKSLDYTFFSNASVAQFVAQRELQVASKPLISCKIVVNRDAYDVNLGDAILVSFDEYDIKNIVFRVREAKFGTFDDNKIELTITQDAFQYGYSLFEPIESSGYKSPANDKYSVIKSLVLQAPAFFSKRNADYISANDTTDDSLLIAYTPYSQFNRFLQCNDDLYSAPFESVSYKTGAEVFHSTLKTEINQRFSTTININAELNNYSLTNELNSYVAEQLKENKQNICYIKDTQTNKSEFFAFEAVEVDGTGGYNLLNCKRGLFDTIPLKHAENTEIFFLRDYVAEEFRVVDQLNGNFEGVLINNYFINIFDNTIVAYDTISSITTGVRNALPIVCKNLRKNYWGTVPVEVINLAGNELAEIKWDHINLNDAKNYYFYDDVTSNTLEADCSYSIRIYDVDENLIKSVDNITDDNYQYYDEPFDGVNYLEYLKIQIFKVNNTTLAQSLFTNEIEIVRNLIT